MASEAALRRQINDLRDQLNRLTRDQAELRSQLERRTAEEIRRMRDEMDRTLKEHKRQMDAEYTAVVQKYRDDIEREMQRSIDEIRRAEEKANEERRKIMRELDEANKTLNRELEELKNREKELSEKSRELASRQVKEAELLVSEISLLPHEFFCPNEFELFREHLAFAENLIKSGMCEAAVAATDTAITELQIFEIRVKERQQEWVELYEIYSLLIKYLHEQMTAFEQKDFEAIVCEKRLTEKERAYWSGGSYAAVRSQIEEHFKLVDRIERADSLTACLCEGNVPKRTALDQEIPELRKMIDRFSAVCDGMQRELLLSALRCLLGNTASEAAEKLGYQIVSCCYRDRSALDSFDVTLTVNGIDTVLVSLVPVRRDGVAVENSCLVTAKIISTPEPEFVKQTAKDVGSAITAEFRRLAEETGAFRGIHVTCFSDENQAKTAEDSQKQKLNIDQYAKKRERKYR